MITLKIKKIEIQGFRAFGKSAQTLDFDSLIAVAWGPNSQGKTSFAEAIEFLLTGQIVRRELLASAQDEFADALRNVHMPSGTETFVQATLSNDGQTYIVRRTLDTDYRKKQDCQSTLLIDGRPSSEADLVGLGIVLSQSPLRAPVLAQHTLAYLFSARPQDRAGYFKALLEVTDLEVLRAAVAGIEADLNPPANPVLSRFMAAVAIPAAASHLRVLLLKVPTSSQLAAAIDAAHDALIRAEGKTPPADTAEKAEAVEALLDEKRGLTFPMKGFDKTPFRDGLPALDASLKALTGYLEERKKVDEEARRLAGLFAEALALPHVADAQHPVDCPLCGAAASLTPERTAFIRSRAQDSEAFRASEKAAAAAVKHLETELEGVSKRLADAAPRFLVYPSKARRARGLRVDRVRLLLPPASAGIVTAWLRELRPFARAWSHAVRLTATARAVLQPYAERLDALEEGHPLQKTCDELLSAIKDFKTTLGTYVGAEAPLVKALKTVVDAQSATTGWAELAELARNKPALRASFIESAAAAQMQKELGQALRQIDAGNEKVLQDKFEALSADVETWWNLLRPDELSFFAAVQPRPGARRTIDFKAGLSANEDRSAAALRDVIAVFSQSQLHCLGLALFIARSVHEKTGFIVLDDPILSSDEDYRAHFNSAVLDKLIDSGVQVILLTQDQTTCKDLTERYLHRQIGTFQIALTNPREGTSVVNKADDLAARFSKAEVLIRGGHPDLHKQGGEVLRDAAERLCKEIIVRTKRAKGNHAAVISDYDHKTLGELGPLTEPLLTIDPSHPGKLRAIGHALNPAKHDAPIPGSGTLKVALGDMKALKKTYL